MKITLSFNVEHPFLRTPRTSIAVLTDAAVDFIFLLILFNDEAALTINLYALIWHQFPIQSKGFIEQGALLYDVCFSVFIVKLVSHTRFLWTQMCTTKHQTGFKTTLSSIENEKLQYSTRDLASRITGIEKICCRSIENTLYEKQDTS